MSDTFAVGPSKLAESTLRDALTAPEGRLKIEWVKAHMPILNEIRREFAANKPFAGKKVALSIHLEAKTAYMAQVLAVGGADVYITGSNPLSTQDDVSAALAESGVTVHAWHAATTEEYFTHLNRVLDAAPDLLLDDGGDLTTLLHTSRVEAGKNLLGLTEETSTGVQRLQAMNAEGVLRYPAIAVNNAYMKHLFDNRYGTGQSAWNAIMQNTNLTVAGKTAVVAGYGWCGKGVAARAAGLGARVIVCEVDPIKANEAVMDGYRVMPMIEAVKEADFVVTVTGCEGVVREEHLRNIKDGCVLANAGHFDAEISKVALQKLAGEPRTVRKNVQEYAFADGRRVHLIGEGRLVNLAAGDGHPAEVMDMSFAVQVLTLQYILENAGTLEKQLYQVPALIDTRVAELRLRSLGVQIDRLTPEQDAYLHAWKV